MMKIRVQQKCSLSFVSYFNSKIPSPKKTSEKTPYK